MSQSSGPKELDSVLEEIAVAAAQCLEIERVSIWRFTAGRDAISCLTLYEQSPDRHTRGGVLAEQDFPAYFGAMTSERAIVASDAHTHAATREFSTPYLTPNRIHSMLDAPIRVGGQLFGVLCHESVGEARAWTEDEVDFAGSVADLTALAISNDQLRRNEEILQLALEAGDVGTFVWRPITGELDCDERCRRIFHWDPDQRLSYDDFVDRLHPDDVAKVEAAIEDAIERMGEYRAEMRVLHNGTQRVVEARGRVFPSTDPTVPDHMTGVCYDVTERHQIEQRAYEMQKLDSLGLLAGGIAHDFNNLLVAVMGNASLMLMDVPPESEFTQPLEEIQSASERAAELCRQLLAYSGRGTFAVGPVDLGERIQESAALLRASIGKNIRVTTDLAPALPAVRGDATQLTQVVMNLAINSADAIGTGRDGTITITTGTRDSAGKPTEWLVPTPRATGPFVFVTVDDNGGGIAADAVDRIFDPFFSTKETGHGLGLAAVQGIVRSHHGALRLSSDPGRGTCFEILLPAMEGAAPSTGTTRRVTPGATRSGVALLADDEASVRATTTVMLRRIGYEVEVVADGRDAMDRFDRDPGRISIAFLDLTMPRAGGVQVARHLRRARADLPIVMFSGYNADDLADELGELGCAFVQKPFRTSQLLAAIEQVEAG